jgi:HK97 family phage portal protein
MHKEVRKIFGIPVYSRSIISTGTTANPVSDALRGTNTEAGINVDAPVALTISAVWRAVNVVSGTLAFLPLDVFRKEKSGSRTHLSDHPVQLIIDEPNSTTTDFIFRQSMHAARMLYGNAYALIERKEGGRPVALHFIHPDSVTPHKNREGIFYTVAALGIIHQKDMIHLHGLSYDGLKGKSFITVARESIALAKAAETFGSRFFGSGTKNSGIIEVPGKLDEQSYKNLKASWDAAYTGLGNSHGTPILEAGATYKPISVPPEDAQFLGTRQFQIEEIARWFGVQPHILMDLSRSTNNNIEHQGMEFVRYTLAPELRMWESELKRKLFTGPEKADHYIEFNLNALLRGDSKSRSEFYKGMFAVGAMSPNEIRKLENVPGYPEGDRKYVQAGFVPVDKIDSVYTTKTDTND